MSFSFASIKAAIAHVFGIEEAKAHHLVDAVIADAAPLLTQFEDQIHGLLTEGHADVTSLFTKGLADVKTDIAEIKAMLQPAPAPTPAEPTTPPAAG